MHPLIKQSVTNQVAGLRLPAAACLAASLFRVASDKAFLASSFLGKDKFEARARRPAPLVDLVLLATLLLPALNVVVVRKDELLEVWPFARFGFAPPAELVVFVGPFQLSARGDSCATICNANLADSVCALSSSSLLRKGGSNYLFNMDTQSSHAKY